MHVTTRSISAATRLNILVGRWLACIDVRPSSAETYAVVTQIFIRFDTHGGRIRVERSNRP
jgi:hypothetical protein